MRIAQIAPLARAVGPRVDSSIEQLVWLLTEQLVARGHDVTLYASGDSQTSARLVAPYPLGYRRDARLWDDWQFHELVHLTEAFAEAGAFDVIHSHAYAFPSPLAALVDTPVVHTDHLPTRRAVAAAYARHPGLNVVALSRYHASKLRGVDVAAVIPNAVDVASFPFSSRGGDHLLFLGHLIPRKGPVEAIEVARAAGLPLVLAGKGEGEYFESRIVPLLREPGIEYVGPVDAAERDRLLAGAGALLFTSLSAEPFGLVLIEAMACGTPVAALERCAVPEIVEPGVSGWYAPDPAALAAVIPDVLSLDRAGVRRAAAQRFDAPRMTDDYEALYRRLLERRRAGPLRPAALGAMTR